MKTKLTVATSNRGRPAPPPIMEEIDRVLAEHYGFTDEELDFILNYDIKYRLGTEEGEE